jgi:hypothetical protein
LLAKNRVGVEKLFSRDFMNEIRSQVIESSFAVGTEITALVPFSTAIPDYTNNRPTDRLTASGDRPSPSKTVRSKTSGPHASAQHTANASRFH